jgi:hypothetical protein
MFMRSIVKGEGTKYPAIVGCDDLTSRSRLANTIEADVARIDE